jgi:ABC-2 type transport system permease protein
MRIFDLAIKDLKQILRDRRAFLFLLLMPITFTFFFGWVFGNIGTSDDDPRLPVGWISLDETNILGDELLSLLEVSDAIRPEVLQGEDAENAVSRVQENEIAAAIFFPAGFSIGSEDEEPVKITLIVDQFTPAGQTATNAVQAALARLLGSIQIAEISTDTYQELEDFNQEEEREQYFESAFEMAIQAWEQPPLGLQIVHQSTDEVETEFNPYFQASPGMLIQFTVFGLINSATLLVIERKTRTLQRMMTTPISRSETIAGHLLAMFIVVLIQQMILIILGQFLGLEYFRQPLALLLLVVSFALFASSYGLLIGVLAKSEEQVMMIGMLSMFLLTALAGAWFPLEMSGEAFATIGRLTPTAWAMEGFQNLILRGQGLESVLLNIGIIIVYAVLCFVLAVWRFRYE